MSFFRLGFLCILGQLLLSSTGALANGEYYRRGLKDDGFYEPVPYSVTTAHGCYFHRGRRYCSRYCYTEYNGHRYCQPRLRDAYPQAGIWVEEVYPRRSHW